MIHVRTLRDAFLADILMDLKKLILLFILCFKLTKHNNFDHFCTVI